MEWCHRWGHLPHQERGNISCRPHSTLIGPPLWSCIHLDWQSRWREKPKAQELIQVDQRTQGRRHQAHKRQVLRDYSRQITAQVLSQADDQRQNHEHRRRQTAFVQRNQTEKHLIYLRLGDLHRQKHKDNEKFIIIIRNQNVTSIKES